MSDTVEDVLIVGGGDVGLLTALALRKQLPELEIAVVDDFSSEVPQVGKSTYLEIQNLLHGELEIEEPRFIDEVKPIWKASVFFRDWCDRDPFHYPFDSSSAFNGPDLPATAQHHVYHYDVLYDSQEHLTRCGQLVAQGKSPWYRGPDGDLDRYDKCAYHLTTRRFNGFLRTLCRERGVTLVDDRITDVDATGTTIDGVNSADRRYEADLYVDATGFNRVLRGEQDAEFRDFGFPLDAAYNVRIDRDLADVEPATVIETGDHGWFWQIDTYDNRDLGYVFGSEYVDDDDALDEFREYVESLAPDGVDPSIDAEDVDTYEFTSGYFQRGWVDNCLAIGNAGGFVEPLQSTALTANASLAIQFGKLLAARGRIADDDAHEAYNRTFERTWESIYDFVAAHYRYATGDTEFWHAMATMDFSPRLDRIVEEFDRYGYAYDIEREHADGIDELTVFSVPDFYAIMRNMGASSVFYETNDFRVSKEVVQQLEEYYAAQRRQVASNHLTVTEFYEDVLEA